MASTHRILGISTTSSVIWFDELPKLLSQLGKHKTSKGCLYINRLSEVDLAVLEEIIARSLQE